MTTLKLWLTRFFCIHSWAFKSAHYGAEGYATILTRRCHKCGWEDTVYESLLHGRGR